MRWPLFFQAKIWRSLGWLVMFLDKFISPRPISPNFTKRIPTTLSSSPGRIKLLFYAPSSYGKDPKRRYPVIVNFHGGGWTMGAATDDARWATAVVQQADAVVCSVEYRLAPEHPFPTAVQDGVDAVLYLHEHADELLLDKDKIATSGFSAGGNLAITVPIMLRDVLQKRAEVGIEAERIVKAIVAWYPATDCLNLERQKGAVMPEDKRLPRSLVALFYESYLYPREEIPLESPCLSPAVASDEVLLAAMPDDVFIYTCEWDILLAEGRLFADRMKGLDGKRVAYKEIPGVMHAWDKLPSFSGGHPTTIEMYKEACGEIKRVLQE